MDGIEDVLRLNTRIVAAEAVVSGQAAAIVEMTEAREDTVKAEKQFSASRNDLRLLRARRDTLLDELSQAITGAGRMLALVRSLSSVALADGSAGPQKQPFAE